MFPEWSNPSLNFFLFGIVIRPALFATLHGWQIEQFPVAFEEAVEQVLSQYERTPLIWGLLRENSQQT